MDLRNIENKIDDKDKVIILMCFLPNLMTTSGRDALSIKDIEQP